MYAVLHEKEVKLVILAIESYQKELAAQSAALKEMNAPDQVLVDHRKLINLAKVLYVRLNLVEKNEEDLKKQKGGTRW
jgi:hypothetical protein